MDKYSTIHSLWDGLLTFTSGILVYTFGNHQRVHAKLEEKLDEVRSSVDRGPQNEDFRRLEEKIDRRDEKIDKLIDLIYTDLRDRKRP